MPIPKLWSSNGIFLLLVIVVSRAVIWCTAFVYNSLGDAGRTPTNLLCSLDAGWYMSIVKQGYHDVPVGHDDGAAANWAFFPLFPLVVRVVGATGLSELTSAYLVNHVAFAIALVVFFRYCIDCLSLSESTSRFIAASMAFSPYSLYFSVPYTEALYFLFMILTVYLLATDRWLLMGIAAAFLSATRNLGVFIALPALSAAVKQYGWRSLLTLRPVCNRALIGLMLVPLGLLSYMLYLHHHIGDALAFVHIQRAWGLSEGNIFVRVPAELNQSPGYFASLAVVLASLAAAVYLLQKRYVTESLILLLGTLIPFSVRLMSMPRFVFTLFPIYLALGLITENRPRTRAVVLGLFVLLSIGATMLWVASSPVMV